MIGPREGVTLHPTQGVKVVEWQDRTLFGLVTVVWIMPVMTPEQVKNDIREWFHGTGKPDSSTSGTE